jgi:large subunit ribosomal protein L22
MNTSKASLKNLRISARKVRLVADMIRGKQVEEARNILSFNDKKAAEPLKKLLDSAVANAEHAATETKDRVDTDEWVVGMIQVNEGRTLYRFQPAARGRAAKIRKRSSHIDLVLQEKK